MEKRDLVLEAYLNDVRRHTRVTPEEEHILAQRIVEGDITARQRLVEANLRLVILLANEHHRRTGQRKMDLIQEGNIGLMEAADRFDPNRGVRFSTYAAWWINARIKRFALKNQRIVRIATTADQYKILYGIRRVQRDIEAQGIIPTSERIAEELGVSAEEVDLMLGRLYADDRPLSTLPTPWEEESRDEQRELSDNSLRPDTMMEDHEYMQQLREVLDTFAAKLKDRERVIFEQRMVHEDPCTLEELGQHFGCTRERVRQLEEKIKNQLHKFLKSILGQEFIGHLPSIVHQLG